MSCLRVGQIHLYLEGELDESGRLEVESHLRTCPACRRAVEERRILQEAALTLPPLEVPAGFSRRILDRIPAKGATPLTWAAALVSGAGILFLIFLGAYLLTGQSLPSLLISANRGLWNALAQSATTAGKALEIIVVAFRLLGGLLESARKILGILSASLLRPETLAPGVAFLVILSVLFVIGMKRILTLGEKS